jgi:hypothetical protein
VAENDDKIAVSTRNDSADATESASLDARDTIVTGPIEVDPPLAAQPRGAGQRRLGETTLMSVPAPADRSELEIEDRLTANERKLDRLEERLAAIESRGSARPAADQGWLVWVVFLLAIAVAWQLFQGAR